MTASENGPGIYANAQVQGNYILSGGLEKLYAYRPTFFREHTSQAAALTDQDFYHAILGEAILDSRPISRWVYDQGLGQEGSVESGIYTETYANFNHDGTNAYFWAKTETWQWISEENRAVKVTPQSVTCRIYRLNGEYLTETRADSNGFCPCQVPNVTGDTSAIRAEIHIEAAGQTVNREVIAFKYQDFDGKWNSWLGLVGNDGLPLLIDGSATINLQTVTGATQTLQAPVTSGVMKIPVIGDYGVADIDINTPTLQYHYENYPFTYRPRGVIVNPTAPYIGLYTDKWLLTSTENARLIVTSYPAANGGSLTIQYKRVSGDTWHTLVEGAQLQNGRYEHEWKPNYSGEGYAQYLLKASWQQDPASPVVASNSLLVRQEGGVPPPVCEYTIAANPPSISVQQGGSASTTLTATETSGTCDVISWTVNDLGGATGLTATIDSTAGLTVRLTVTAQPTTNMGTYTVTIRAAAGTITKDTTVAVTVEQQGAITKYPLTVNVNPGSAGTVNLNPQTPDNWYDRGTSIQATVTPSEGYSFNHWELDDQNVGANQPYTFTMDAPHVLTAVSAPQPPPVQPPAQPPPRCIIATAAYGSEMAPEVAYMRHVRDNLIASTPTGKTLRDAFNAWYYSWSPPIAQVVSANPVLQAIFRILLQPIVAIVHIAAWTYMSIGGGDTAAVAAFTIAAILAVAAYIATPTLALLALKRYKANRAKTKALNFDDRTSEPAFKS
jgi:hypothetical protein